MTQEEIAQVQHYIQGLEAKHAHALQVQTKGRILAQQDLERMRYALHEVWKLSKNPPPADMFGTNVRQIINFYAPDWDIPF
jgi:hypothetical protein